MGVTINDHFEVYYREKLWEIIPAIYRHEDGLATPPGVLKALVEVIARQAAILRRSEDRLWEDQFIDTCDDWAVPYLGELLATRLLSAQNKRGRRIDVAKTIYYRRRKGTPRILEELINDVSNWDGKLVEGFGWLVRARHGLDPKPLSLAGRFTGTLPGGIADLRSPIGSEVADGPFEEYFHTPDFRKPKGLQGRYGISKLNFYLYRLFSYPLKGVTPFFAEPDRYTFDPSGRNIPLFNQRRRPEGESWEDWQSAPEWDLPLPIRCRLLAHSVYMVREAGIEQLPSPFTDIEKGELRRLSGWTLVGEERLKATLDSFPLLQSFLVQFPEQFGTLLRVFQTENCGKSKLIPDALAVLDPALIGRETIMAANLENGSVPGINRRLAIDAEKGQFLFLDNPPAPEEVTVNYHYGFPGPLGAGTYYRGAVEDSTPDLEIPAGGTTLDLSLLPAEGVVQINDNRTYFLTSNPPFIQRLVLQAANFQRPYLVLHEDLVFESLARDATLILDGLWIGSPSGLAHNIIIRGDYECVVIRNCTLDPGGGNNAQGETLLPVTLVIEGKIENFCIEWSITGPVQFGATSLLDESLSIQDSIVQALPPVGPDPAVPAIQTGSGKLELLRTTVLGGVSVHRLYASEVIITGTALVRNTQTGCFRFSAAPALSRLPRPYESFQFSTDHRHWFTSRLFGQPGYAQLSDTAPEALKRGGESGSEMGAFSSLLNSIKGDGLRIKVEEYMPFGLIPAFIHQT